MQPLCSAESLPSVGGADVIATAVAISRVGAGGRSKERIGSMKTATKNPREAGIVVAVGGGSRNRTGVDGFAGRCMTTLPSRPGWTAAFRAAQTKRESPDQKLSLEELERETSLELATSTLARLRSTN